MSIIASVFSRRSWLPAALLFLALVPAAQAMLPPQTDAQLRDRAEVIVTGQVTQVSEKVVRHQEDSAGSRIYPRAQRLMIRNDDTITLRVASIEKGQLGPDSSSVTFSAYHFVQVPRGWVDGDDTLDVTLHVGDKIKVYLDHDSQGWKLFHAQGMHVLPQ
jgi:hypothetical protein